MQTLRKRIQAQATDLRANLDTAIKEKLEQARTRLEGDTAWSVATRVLEKVRAVRESLQKATSQKASPAKSTAARSKTSKSTTRKPKTAARKTATKTRKTSIKAPRRAH